MKYVESGQGKTIYVLDSNVLMYDPEALFGFEDAVIGIPIVVLEELDKFKREGTDKGRNTRAAIRHLDAARTRGSLGQGVELGRGSEVRILFLPKEQEREFPFELDLGDNRILLTVLNLQEEGHAVRFVTKDINARVKADALGIHAQDYLKEVHVTHETFYKGWTTIQVPSIELKKTDSSFLRQLAQDQELVLNQFVLLESRHNPHNYQVFRYYGGNQFARIDEPVLKWAVQPRNAQQLMALNLLLDDTVKLISLFGPAGTGKTFLALLAGLHKVLVEDMYEKILISRPIVPLGRDIGYLPGTLEEKLHSWMLPIHDNMDFIIHVAQAAYHVEGVAQEYRKIVRKKGKKQKGDKNGSLLQSLDELVERGKLSLEAITYMRGRSIPYQFILIDEVQNLSPHEVKTLVTRVGEGSKIILAGDPYQIDSPYLDFSSNGLVVTSERFKGQPLFGTVYLQTSERSELSQLAGQLL